MIDETASQGMAPGPDRRRWPHGFLVWLAIACAVVYWFSPLWGIGESFWSSHSLYYDLARAIGVREAWRYGIWDARWFPNFNWGYGYPFLSYYAPLFHWMSGLLHFVTHSPSLAVRLNVLFWLSLGAIGSALAVQDFWSWFTSAPRHRHLLLIGAFSWLSMSYPMCQVFVRGALPEFASTQTLPWIAYFASRLFLADSADAPHSWRMALMASLAVALAILSHNFAGQLAFGFALVIGAVFYLSRWFMIPPPQPRVLQSSVRVRLYIWLAAMALALVLTCFFWMPAIGEASYVHLDSPSIHWAFVHHFVELGNLARVGFWGFGGSGEGVAGDGMPLHLGFIGHFIAIASIAVILRLGWERRLRPLAVYLLLNVCTIIALVLTMRLSFWLWVHFPPIRPAQFPWRIFSIVSVGLLLLAPSPLLLFAGTQSSRRALVVVPYLLLFLLSQHYYARIAAPYPFNWENINRQENVLTADHDEYAPRWRPAGRGNDWVPQQAIAPTTTEVTRISTEGRMPVYRVGNPSDSDVTITLAMNYFPGWRAGLDGGSFAKVSPDPETGFLSVSGIPPGTSQLSLSYKNTSLRSACKWLSALGWIVWLGLLWRTRRAR